MNDLSQEGMRRLKVISDKAVSEAVMRACVPGAAREFVQVKCYGTAALSLFYGEVTYPCREFWSFRVACIERRVRKLVVWKFMPGEGYRLREVVEHLSEWYFVQVHHKPQFAFVRVMPKEASYGQLVVIGEGWDVQLFDAEWIPAGCVAVGG